jgi:hypothetical protein
MRNTRFIEFWRGLDALLMSAGLEPACAGEALAAWHARAVAMV